ASWQGAIVAALNRAKRPQAETGVASVRFSVDRGGRVTSASLAGSTGVGSLDQEAVALVRRASLPPAPAEVPGGSFTFTVPVRFTSR
ncbi:MAG: TonB-like protein, partial [Enterovirga sp.]|nr:TonB-like protein [Enterovirga sp.]